MKQRYRRFAVSQDVELPDLDDEGLGHVVIKQIRKEDPGNQFRTARVPLPTIKIRVVEQHQGHVSNVAKLVEFSKWVHELIHSFDLGRPQA